MNPDAFSDGCPDMNGGMVILASAGIGHNGGTSYASPVVGAPFAPRPGPGELLFLNDLTNPTPEDIQKLHAYDQVRSIVKPNGNWIGEPEENSGIRHVSVGSAQAGKLFDQMKTGATEITPTSHPDQLYRSPGDIGTIGYRPISKKCSTDNRY